MIGWRGVPIGWRRVLIGGALTAVGGCGARPAPIVEVPMPGLRAAPADGATAETDEDMRWPRGCEAAVALALAAHPGPAAAQAALAAAEADARVAITPAPELRVQAGLPQLEDGGRVGLRMPLPSPGEARTRDALERARVQLAEAELTDARVELAAAVRLLHLTARRARAAAERAGEAAALADVSRDAIAAQASAGVVPAVALADARLVRAAADADQRRALAEATRAEAALRRLAGYGAADPACAPPAMADADATPASRIARASAAVAEAEATLEADQRGMALEWIEVAWDAVPSDPDRMLLGFTIRLPSLALAADPVTAHRRAARVEQAAAERAASDVVADAWVGWRVAEARYAALRDDPALAEAEALLEKVQATRGKAPEVLALRRRVIAARIALDAARFDAEEAGIELRRARGIE